jgi:hypothetical protein
MLVWRSYLRTEPAYVARDAWSFLKDMIKLVLFEENRVSKLRAVSRGARDALSAGEGV